MQDSTALGELLVRIVHQTRVPAISVSVMKNGRMRSAYAGIDPHGDVASMARPIRFDIGCITTMLVSLAALQLVSTAELDLQAPIEFYLHDLPPNVRSARILVWHLLSHSSGYVGIAANDRKATENFSWREFLAFLASSRQVFRPGTVFNYHIADQAMLGEILTRLTGMQPLELVRTKILEPMDLGRPPEEGSLGEHHEASRGHRWNRRSGAFEKCPGVKYSPFSAPALSGPRLTTDEMLRLVVAIMSGCNDTDAGGKAIDAMTSRLFQRQVVNVPAPARRGALPRALVSYGLGCGAYTDGSLGISGTAAGQSSAVHFDSTSRTAVAVALSASAIAMRDRIGTRLLNALRGADPWTVTVPGASFLPEELTGPYVGGVDGHQVRVSLHKGDFVLRYVNECLGRVLERKFMLGGSGELQFESDSGPLQQMFFREPGSRAVCLMCGWLAYKKVAAS